MKTVKLLVLDVDGVLTDGTLYYGPNGEELKAFSVRDGLGIRMLMDHGIQVAVLSGRASEAVRFRMKELGVKQELVVEGSRDKGADFLSLCRSVGVLPKEAAAMGDDVPDIPMLKLAGLAACPSDAHEEVKRLCHLVLRSPGGRGAVRELAELLVSGQQHSRGR